MVKFLQLGTDDAVQLLSHLLTFVGSKSEALLKNGKVLGAYLDLLAMLLDKMPVGLFEARKESSPPAAKGKGKEVEVIVIADSDDEDAEPVEDVVMAPPPSELVPERTLDPRTASALSILPSRQHLTSLLSLSTHFSTTRPNLATFMVSLLQTLPKKRDDILNIIMYGVTPGGLERGGGLVREIWRGYIRAGPLGKLLAGSGENVRTGSALLQALKDDKLSQEWPTLILLIELFSKSLFTMGDDEFYAGTKNPLSLDEVVGLSGLLRNLAFALYWQEGILSTPELGTGTPKVVVGTRMTVERMRTLVTTLLQQIHARE